MASKYHISAAGVPAVCRAKSEESCPKTKAGDGFHGDLTAATFEAERRFGQDYGETVSFGKEQQQEAWDRAALALHREAVASLRAIAPDLVGEERGALEEKIDLRKRAGLAALHGVASSSVRSHGSQYVVSESDGARRVYGLKGRKVLLGYLGVLHPKLASPVVFSSESKAMVGNREASDGELNHPRGASALEFYGYATVHLQGSTSPVTVTTDAQGLPTAKHVWSFLKDTPVPRELLEDTSLHAAIAKGGILKY